METMRKEDMKPTSIANYEDKTEVFLLQSLTFVFDIFMAVVYIDYFMQQKRSSQPIIRLKIH